MKLNHVRFMWLRDEKNNPVACLAFNALTGNEVRYAYSVVHDMDKFQFSKKRGREIAKGRLLNEERREVTEGVLIPTYFSFRTENLEEARVRDVLYLIYQHILGELPGQDRGFHEQVPFKVEDAVAWLLCERDYDESEFELNREKFLSGEVPLVTSDEEDVAARADIEAGMRQAIEGLIKKLLEKGVKPDELPNPDDAFLAVLSCIDEAKVTEWARSYSEEVSSAQ